MGILVMNIVSMGMPGYAYIDPTYYGGSTGADWWAWALAYVFADGKMRMLFTMLFGASLAIVTDRAEHPARTHYSRMVWLLVFGMLHAWFVWYGDILVEYALLGMVLYVARKWPPQLLFMTAAALVILGAIPELAGGMHLAELRRAASLPGATPAAMHAWTTTLAEIVPPRSVIPFELAHYRGGFLDALTARIPMTTLFQTAFVPNSIVGTTGIAAFGLALYRTGFLTGQNRTSIYVATIVAGGLALVFYVPLVRLIVTSGYDPVLMTVTNNLSLILRPFVALGYAAVLILMVRSGRLQSLVGRIGAAGRAAFTNYLGTSLVATTIFYGYGFGLFGHLSRAELYIVVAGIWVVILLWSKPWLERFHYGPFEWLWRSLARGKVQPFRRQIRPNP
jgi:uncharacterized protein